MPGYRAVLLDKVQGDRAGAGLSAFSGLGIPDMAVARMVTMIIA